MSLPAGTYGAAEVSLRDAGNEIGVLRTYGAALSDSNWVSRQTAWSNFTTKVQAISLGAMTRRQYGNETLYSTTQPENGGAREFKLLVQCQDDTNGQKFHFTIPCLDPTKIVYVLNDNAKDVVRTDTPTEVTDLITAVEGFVVNPRTGNSAVVVGLKAVGRNT